MKIPFWEESYKDDHASLFGAAPNATLVAFQSAFHPKDSVLDVGCGVGKNALYLAGLGFRNIDAFDLSENAIAKLKRLAHSQGVQVNAWVQDLADFTFTKKYDLIFSFGVLHFVEKRIWHSFIRLAKENTNPQGIHIIQLFTNALPPTEDIAPYAVGLAYDLELKSLYSDWSILQFRSYAFEEEHPGVPRHQHASNKIVAQKK